MTVTTKRALRSMGKTDAEIEAMEGMEKVEAAAVKAWGEFRASPSAETGGAFAGAVNTYLKGLGLKGCNLSYSHK